MKLSTRTRYAIMAIVDIAYYSKGSPVNLADIAKRENIAVNYLEQIFVNLRKNNLVESVKGPGGGYKLSKPADQITVADVMRSMDINFKMTRCGTSKDKKCVTDSVKCMTHGLWKGLESNIVGYFSAITLQDVISKNVNIRQETTEAEVRVL
ncbi:MAG: Rrf2 family transcriptional regulator [Rickettsiales bacterium]